MDHRFIALIFALSAGPAFAGYAQLAPPPGFSGSGTARAFQRIAANDAITVANTVRTSASLSVNGRAVTMPVSMRYAANASRVAARFAFANPLLLGLTVASLAYDYYKNSGYELKDGAWIKNEMQTVPCSGVCREYQDLNGDWGTLAHAAEVRMLANVSQWRYSVTSMNEVTGDIYFTTVLIRDGYPDIISSASYRATPRIINTEEKIVEVPATPQQFEDDMADKPLPDGVPELLPVPLPVDQPVVNPSADPVPKPQPLRVPMGDPVPIPDTNPQQYRTPVVDIVPSPTATDPWRVDLQPKNLDRLDPTPISDPYAVPPDAVPNETTTPKSDEPVPVLCEVFPDILACAKPELDTPDSQDIETKDVEVQITPDSGWGPSDSSCPPPRIIKAGTVEFSFQPICDFMHGMRPIVISMSWIAAAVILVGAPKGGD